jgi:hypothetical protein
MPSKNKNVTELTEQEAKALKLHNDSIGLCKEIVEQARNAAKAKTTASEKWQALFTLHGDNVAKILEYKKECIDLCNCKTDNKIDKTLPGYADYNLLNVQFNNWKKTLDEEVQKQFPSRTPQQKAAKELPAGTEQVEPIDGLLVTVGNSDKEPVITQETVEAISKAKQVELLREVLANFGPLFKVRNKTKDTDVETSIVQFNNYLNEMINELTP